MALSPNQVAGITENELPDGNSSQAKTMSGRIIEIAASLFDDGTAGTNTEVSAFVCDSTYYPNGLKLLSAKIAPSIAVTANDTHYVTINVNVKTAAGAAVATYATHTTKSTGGLGSLVALNLYTLTPTAANYLVAAGNQVTVAKVKTGNGVAMAGADGVDPLRFVIMAEVL